MKQPVDEQNPFAAPEVVPESFDPSSLLPPSELEPYKADRGARFAGAMVDGLLGAFIGAPFAIFGATVATGPEEMEAFIQLGLAAGYGLLAPVNWYFIVDRGQSLGKMAAGTRIVTEHGAPVDFVKGVIVRSWAVTAAAMCIPFVGLIDAVMIFGQKRQCGHDMIADTIVVFASRWNPYSD